MTTKQIMTTAWTIAREGAKKFGGKARSYIATALRQAWEAARKPIDPQMAAAEAAMSSLQKDGRFKGNLWAKFDKVRIYVEDYGYIAFGRDGRAYPSLTRYKGNIASAAGI